MAFDKLPFTLIEDIAKLASGPTFVIAFRKASGRLGFRSLGSNVSQINRYFREIFVKGRIWMLDNEGTTPGGGIWFDPKEDTLYLDDEALIELTNLHQPYTTSLRHIGMVKRVAVSGPNMEVLRTLVIENSCHWGLLRILPNVQHFSVMTSGQGIHLTASHFSVHQRLCLDKLHDMDVVKWKNGNDELVYAVKYRIKFMLERCQDELPKHVAVFSTGSLGTMGTALPSAQEERDV